MNKASTAGTLAQRKKKKTRTLSHAAETARASGTAAPDPPLIEIEGGASPAESKRVSTVSVLDSHLDSFERRAVGQVESEPDVVGHFLSGDASVNFKLLNPRGLVDEIQKMKLPDKDGDTYYAMVQGHKMPGLCESIKLFFRHIWDIITKLGGFERVAMILRLRLLDARYNSGVDGDEKDLLKKCIEEAGSMYLNAGVIAALVLSLVSGLNFQTVQVNPDTMDKLGPAWSAAVVHAFNIALLMATSVAIFTLYMAARQYNALTVWMPSVESKLWYLHTVGQLHIAVLLLAMFVLLGTAIPLGVVVSKGPVPGAYAAGVVGLFFVAALWWEIRCDVACGMHLWTFVAEVQKNVQHPSQLENVAEVRKNLQDTSQLENDDSGP